MLQSTIHQNLKILSLEHNIEQRMLTQTINFCKFTCFFLGVTTFRKFAISYTLK